jgi:hypothetical protein
VQFRDGGRPLGAPVTLVNGAASLVVPAFAGGRHDVWASYSGDGNFMAATSTALRRTVQCDQTVTGTINSYQFRPGTTCFASATVAGQLTIPQGARVSMVDSSFDRLTATQVAALIVCGTRINNALTLTRAAGTVSIGDPYSSACRPNQIGDTTINQSQRGVSLLQNSFAKDVFVMGTSGGPTLIGGNTVTGTLACNNNTPAATNGGYVNNAANRKGECATIDSPPAYQQR